MSWISYSGYRSAHGRPSGDIISASEWEPIEQKVVEASKDLVRREAELDIELAASKVSDDDWKLALAKAQQAKE